MNSFPKRKPFQKAVHGPLIYTWTMCSWNENLDTVSCIHKNSLPKRDAKVIHIEPSITHNFTRCTFATARNGGEIENVTFLGWVDKALVQRLRIFDGTRHSGSDLPAQKRWAAIICVKSVTMVTWSNVCSPGVNIGFVPQARSCHPRHTPSPVNPLPGWWSSQSINKEHTSRDHSIHICIYIYKQFDKLSDGFLRDGISL